MTPLQKEIALALLKGGPIAGNSRHGLRLRSAEAHVLRKVDQRSFHTLRPLLRRCKGLFVINKSKVRQLHGKSWVYQQYKALREAHGRACEPCIYSPLQ